ncbi:primosomal protein [Caulobacter sp. D4A]|uniref:primosomal protein n=1 Tax=unclassified Caulobacter TaxID=2648921 RepID=UPI000D736D92|nr:MULTISPECIES: primosomal protein [unclassified Caulobacter]PXA75564.1 primosomal protein [Caulobacter sp. D4A]PXA88892.1 primosomal protein [Caulobacter sp. D5]
MPPETDFEPQDVAEVLDETNLTEDGEDIANFDDIEDVYDVTQAEDDASEDEDEDLDLLDDDELVDIDDELEAGRDDEGLDVEREPLDPVGGGLSDEDQISDDSEEPSDYESTRLADDDIEALGYDKRG